MTTVPCGLGTAKQPIPTRDSSPRTAPACTSARAPTRVPAPIRAVTYIVPARYFLVALRSIVLKGAGLGIFWPQLVALAIYAAFMLTMASRRLHRQWT